MVTLFAQTTGSGNTMKNRVSSPRQLVHTYVSLAAVRCSLTDIASKISQTEIPCGPRQIGYVNGEYVAMSACPCGTLCREGLYCSSAPLLEVQ